MAERRVLIIDDDPDIAEAMALVLESTGAVVEICEDVDSGLERCAEIRPHLILVDLMLPEPTDGYHFIYRLREEAPEEIRNTPVVLLSSLSRSEMDKLRYPDEPGAPFPAGEPVPVTAFLEKPTAPARLIALAEEFLP